MIDLSTLTEAQLRALIKFAELTKTAWAARDAWYNPRSLPEFGERNAVGNGLCRALSGAAKRGALEQHESLVAYRVSNEVREAIGDGAR